MQFPPGPIAMSCLQRPHAIQQRLTQNGNYIVPWSSHIVALIVGDDADTHWKYNMAKKRNIPIVHESALLPDNTTELWVSKYAPKLLTDIVGNAEGIRRCMEWLKNWESQTMHGAFLSGPPGIGKTTTAHLLAKSCGYEVVEMNASDIRSATAIREIFQTALRSHAFGNRKRVIIMDEVDGMSSGDRGGVGELARIIKETSFPIVCIANERTHPKLRPLHACTIDIRMNRPLKTQIAKHLLQTICKHEKLMYTLDELEDLVEKSGNDIRQVIHQLQFYACGSKDEILRNDPFSATVRLFSGHGTMDHVFVDHALVPLMVQEAYITTADRGNGTSSEKLQRIAHASELLGVSDILNESMYKHQHWGLMPYSATHTMYAAKTVKGSPPFQLFPSYLGKMSKQAKNVRNFNSLRTRIGCSPVYDALEVLRLRLFRETTNPETICDSLESFHLTRDDMLETLCDSVFPGDEHIVQMDAKTKGAISRAWKKRGINEPSRTLVDADADSDDDDTSDIPINKYI